MLMWFLYIVVYKYSASEFNPGKRIALYKSYLLCSFLLLYVCVCVCIYIYIYIIVCADLSHT